MKSRAGHRMAAVNGRFTCNTRIPCWEKIFFFKVSCRPSHGCREWAIHMRHSKSLLGENLLLQKRPHVTLDFVSAKSSSGPCGGVRDLAGKAHRTKGKGVSGRSSQVPALALQSHTVGMVNAFSCCFFAYSRMHAYINPLDGVGSRFIWGSWQAKLQSW